MEYTIQMIIDRTARFRRQLVELEKKRARCGSDVPNELWQELVEVSRHLDREERKAQAAGRIKSKQVNDSRREIVETLERYNHWREQMREVEQLFLVNIVRPGYRLKQAIRQREYLRNEYRRIRKSIENESYASLEKLEGDVRRVLTHSDTAFEADQENFEDEMLQEKETLIMPDEIDIDEIIDEYEKDKLVREFKRVVLPAVHPDTSDTADEVFKNVFEVYEKRDYTMMEAYTVQYRGDIEPDTEEDPIEFLEDACEYQDKLQRLLERLKSRVEHLMRDMTPQELEQPERLRADFQQQREELRNRIQEESEHILLLRDKLEELVQLYLDRQSHGWR